MKEHNDWQQDNDQGKLATQEESAEMVQDFEQKGEQDVLDHWEDTVDAEEEIQAEEKAVEQHKKEAMTDMGEKAENATQKGLKISVFCRNGGTTIITSTS
eukprot:13526299-Ditylum_brightwellii.AAC.1